MRSRETASNRGCSAESLTEARADQSFACCRRRRANGIDCMGIGDEIALSIRCRARALALVSYE